MAGFRIIQQANGILQAIAEDAPIHPLPGDEREAGRREILRELFKTLREGPFDCGDLHCLFCDAENELTGTEVHEPHCLWKRARDVHDL